MDRAAVSPSVLPHPAAPPQPQLSRPMAAPAPEGAPERVRLRRTDLIFILGFWTFIALLEWANSLTYSPTRTLSELQPLSQLWMSFIDAYLWAVLTPLVFSLANNYPLERGQMLPRACLFFCVGMVIAVGVDVITGFMRFDVFHLGRGRFADAGAVWRLQHLWFMNDFLVFIAVLAGGVARDYFLRYQSRREQTILLQAQAAQLQAQLADARLAALRTQLNPHFLFNTLHAVSALVERDPRGVRRMIARLSELLRTTLDGADEQVVPLGQELTFTHRYLEIMQIRFQGRLSIQSQVEPSALDALVPNLILQPLVENAIKHGVSKIDEEGRIEIHARREDERLFLCVRDNGPRVTENDQLAGEGVGLRNTRERLEQLYGADQSLTLRGAEDGGVIAEVIIPFRKRNELHSLGLNSGSSALGKTLHTTGVAAHG